MKGSIMLGASMLGLNSTGWLKESLRSQHEYLADTDRAISQACLLELRAAAARPDAACC
jgi:hypothetical protein